MRFQGTSISSQIVLGENNSVPNSVQVLRTGKFDHPSYGKFEITKKILAEMKAGFDARVRGVDLAVDYYHASDKEAAGWFSALELRDGGDSLWATVDWTPTGNQKLADRELRYFSPDFTFKWKDPESGKVFENVLFGGGLTNRPFVKEMQAIVANENQGDEMDKIAELTAQNVKLTEEKDALSKKLAEDVAASKKEADEAKAALATAETEKKELSEKLKKVEDEKTAAAKETEFNKLLTEGKACAAQKEAFMKGDMNEFIKLAQPLNPKGTGTVVSDDGEATYEKILKLAEEKMTADPKLDRMVALEQSRKELLKK